MKKALILVDIQNDFCENGALAVKNANQILPIASKLIDEFKDKQQPIIATLDWHPANHKSFASNSQTKIGTVGILNGLSQVWWPDHCIQGTFGSKLHDAIPQEKIDFLVHKGQNPDVDSYSAFFDNDKKTATTLDNYLKQHEITHLTIMGLATDYCVKFTVLDALELGYQVGLITQGCRAVNIHQDDEQLALEHMKSQGASLI